VYPGLIARADVVGFDLFPLQEWCRPERLADVFASQRELVGMAGGKPTFQWIEADDWKCPGGRTAVTPATVRAESWLAIAGGAQGLGFFPARWTPKVGEAIQRMSRDVAKLGPALFSAPASVSIDNAQLRVGARRHNGALYVVAVNAGFTTARATIRLPGLAGRPVSVLDEGRRLPASGSSFSDSFAPLGVHVYVVEPPDSA
jgi:hypothetical protein